MDRPEDRSPRADGAPDAGGREAPESKERHCVVVLYNDHVHRFDEVAWQIRRATGRGFRDAWRKMLRAHEEGRVVVFRGGERDCRRVAAVLREARLQVEVDDP